MALISLRRGPHGTAPVGRAAGRRCRLTRRTKRVGRLANCCPVPKRLPPCRRAGNFWLSKRARHACPPDSDMCRPPNVTVSPPPTDAPPQPGRTPEGVGAPAASLCRLQSPCRRLRREPETRYSRALAPGTYCMVPWPASTKQKARPPRTCHFSTRVHHKTLHTCRFSRMFSALDLSTSRSAWDETARPSRGHALLSTWLRAGIAVISV